MSPEIPEQKMRGTLPFFAPTPEETVAGDSSLSLSSLNRLHEAEARAFLGQRPIHTAMMAGLIRDNGMVSPLNRGTFYACRNAQGRLDGIALIGHAMLFETRTPEALATFARLAQSASNTHMILGEQAQIEQFWHHYSEGGQAARLVCHDLLLQQRWPVAVCAEVEGLRRATLDDLALVTPVQAQMTEEECGVNPLARDPEGFRRRCARRIELARTWVWVEDGRLLFKAEVVSDAPEVAHLEGIWVNQEERGKGYGLRCMSQLGRSLLRRAHAVSVLVNVQNHVALSLYRKAGFRLKSYYDTIYLHRVN